MSLNYLILFFSLIGFGLFFYKYLLLIVRKNNPKLLIDDQFTKPQAFHDIPISTAGGVCIFLSFLITYFYFFLFENLFFIEYLSFCSLFFILGLADDLKIKIKPIIRLALMILFLVILIKYNSFYIDKTGIEFLNNWIQNSKIFSITFVSLCFLFVINGANLIDGYNGLLGIHSLIIILNLFFINFLNANNDITNFLFFIIVILIIFLIFNFPRAKIFLGDSGSYFFGALIAVSVIKTSIDNPVISPFYFCILLFYLFFEVFFSFIRKIFNEKKSPLFPDKKHLHMLIYQYLIKKNKNKFKSNYYVSIILNFVYLISILPAIFMMNNGMFCKYYSILLFLIYLFSYKKIYGKIKKNI